MAAKILVLYSSVLLFSSAWSNPAGTIVANKSEFRNAYYNPLAMPTCESKSYPKPCSETPDDPDGDCIKGVGGVDYPILSHVPQYTEFDCSVQRYSGLYADPLYDCQVFHICDLVTHQKHSFLCPNGTILDQRYATCAWWYDSLDCDLAPKYYQCNENHYNATIPPVLVPTPEPEPGTVQLPPILVSPPLVEPPPVQIDGGGLVFNVQTPTENIKGDIGPINYPTPGFSAIFGISKGNSIRSEYPAQFGQSKDYLSPVGSIKGDLGLVKTGPPTSQFQFGSPAPFGNFQTDPEFTRNSHLGQPAYPAPQFGSYMGPSFFPAQFLHPWPRLVYNILHFPFLPPYHPADYPNYQLPAPPTLYNDPNFDANTFAKQDQTVPKY